MILSLHYHMDWPFQTWILKCHAHLGPPHTHKSSTGYSGQSGE